MPGWFPPQEPDYGNDCLTCYPANLTPRVLGVSLAGIETGSLWLPWMGQPPNGLHVFEQTVANPCSWILPGSPPLSISYWVTPTHTGFSWQIGFAEFAFSVFIANPCEKIFPNSQQGWLNNYFHGGDCQIIALWEVDDPIEDITPIVDPDPLLKIVPRSDGKTVISYIDSWGDTKIKMLVDYTQR